MKIKKYGLALHTTSSQLGITISNFTDETRTQTWDLGRDLSTQLHQYLLEFLQPLTWRDLEFIAVAKGPGSFTSTRIGVVTARTIAQQLDIPLFPICTLAAIAASSKEKYSTGGNSELGVKQAVQMDARRGQLFVGIYQRSSDASGWQEHLAATTMTPLAWQQTLDKLKSAYHLIDGGTNLGSHVSSVLELARYQWDRGKRPHWEEALPFYGQSPVS